MNIVVLENKTYQLIASVIFCNSFKFCWKRFLYVGIWCYAFNAPYSLKGQFHEEFQLVNTAIAGDST